MTVQTRQAVGFQPCSSRKPIMGSSAFCLADAMGESPGEQRDLGYLAGLQGLPLLERRAFLPVGSQTSVHPCRPSARLRHKREIQRKWKQE